MLCHLLAVDPDLQLEPLPVHQGGQRMRVGLGEELNATCLRKLPEGGQHFRCIEPELVNNDTCQRECHFELALVLPDQVQEQVVGRQVTVGSDPAKDRFIHEVVIIIVFMTHLKEAVAPEPEGLMNLEH